MKKLEKRLHDVNVKMERYTCAECLPASCGCAAALSEQYVGAYHGNVSKNEMKSYRRS
jgi:hypothetical protein